MESGKIVSCILFWGNYRQFRLSWFLNGFFIFMKEVTLLITRKISNQLGFGPWKYRTYSRLITEFVYMQVGTVCSCYTVLSQINKLCSKNVLRYEVFCQPTYKSLLDLPRLNRFLHFGVLKGEISSRRFLISDKGQGPSHIIGFQNKYPEKRPFKSHSWEQMFKLYLV